MVEDMKDNTRTIKNMVKVLLLGQIIKNMLVLGRMENSMVLEFLFLQMEKFKKANG